MTLDYALMLISMTFNVGLFFAVIVGLALGSLLFGHTNIPLSKLKSTRRSKAPLPSSTNLFATVCRCPAPGAGASAPSTSSGDTGVAGFGITPPVPPAIPTNIPMEPFVGVGPKSSLSGRGIPVPGKKGGEKERALVGMLAAHSGGDTGDHTTRPPRHPHEHPYGAVW
eukprot:CAMPEP_0173469692 /NCGR_PEP_ID=MMETSP1357-20121228/77495_1 /TAXON_ID=77926 /ORGANISM="Hemiselmis rufescens, Strain PCC563" /LENGTH=167 /DNA_ID=CAMNT_0014437943 /DNA_START=89 /DNA_END=592 /DNA_ORIENTATION=-